MKYCGECGTQLQQEAKFCNKCGSAQEEITQEITYQTSSDTQMNQDTSEKRRKLKNKKQGFRIGPSFFLIMLLYILLLVGDTLLEFKNFNSLNGVAGLLTSGFTGNGFNKVTLMGIEFGFQSISIDSVRFFSVLLIFVVLGLYLSNRKKN